MKTIKLIVSLLLFVKLSIAQDFPYFGQVTNQDLVLKQCDFDKDANAVVLLHEAYSDYDERHQLVTRHHVRMKILKEQGFEEANIRIPFYRKNDFEGIGLVEGMTINETEGHELVVTKLERKSIFTRNVNERLGEVIFTFPAIRVGSIIEYKYRSTMSHYGGLQDWNFQQHLPVISSKYHLVILPNTEFAYRVNKTLDIPISIRPDKNNGAVHFEMNNIPGLGNEPYMDARRDYIQRVIFQLSGLDIGGINKKKYMTSWKEVNRELTIASEFGNQVNKGIPGTGDFISGVKLLANPEDKMKAVFNYVRNQMGWDNVYSKYSIPGVKDAWQKKNGNSGDINLILVNLLKEVGLEAYPMLVSERFHGKVDPVYPFIDQFNSVFASVIIKGRNYYLDATDKTIPPHITPSSILNTTAFVVNSKSGGLVNIVNDTSLYKEEIIAQLVIDSTASVNGSVLVKSSDYARMEKLSEYKTDEKKFLLANFIVDGTSIAGKELDLSNLQNDSSALEMKLNLTGSLNKSGEYFFLPLNLFTGFDHNPFLAANRFSNINFGYKRKINLTTHTEIANCFTIDEAPKSLKLTNPDQDITFIRQVEVDKKNNAVRCMLSFEFKNSLYEADMYPVIKEMYQKMFDYLKEPVVLKIKD